MGIIKDLWESAQNAKTYNPNFYSWFAQWKNEHPEYVKTVTPTNKNKSKSRSFDEKYS